MLVSFEIIAVSNNGEWMILLFLFLIFLVDCQDKADGDYKDPTTATDT